MTIATITTDFGRWWAEVLTLRPLGRDVFDAGPAPSAFPRLYGGQVAAQGLLAAAATVEGPREPHSVHTAFLRGGDNTRPVTYRVERARESRTLSTRLVRAEQDGRLLATAIASFHAQGDGLRYHLEHDIGDAAGNRHDRPAPAPATLPSRPERLAAAFGDKVPDAGAPVWPVDVRYVDRTPWDPAPDGVPAPPCNRAWIRAAARLPDVPAVQAAALTFATDYPMFEPILFPHGIEWAEMIGGRSVYGASLDHALWFHRPPRFDDWLLLHQVSPVATRSRGFCRAEVRSTDGQLVATVAQEVGFVEPRP
ncbi:MAG: acyl-CoA thioesterase [Gemmatimonadales bacterium]|jgi:acyl-CoA thioesterase-2|nr:acyl-CoA thioesterase [Gemmatimonadales bacterium]